MKTKILCGCQSYFGLDALNKVCEHLEFFKIQVKILLPNTEDFNEFEIEVEHSDQLELLKNLASFCCEMEYVQIKFHGDSGGVWVKQIIL